MLLCKATDSWHFSFQTDVDLGLLFWPFVVTLTHDFFCCISIEGILRCWLWENKTEYSHNVFLPYLFILSYAVWSLKLKLSFHGFSNGFQMWILAVKLQRTLLPYSSLPLHYLFTTVFSRLQQALLSSYSSFFPKLAQGLHDELWYLYTNF